MMQKAKQNTIQSSDLTFIATCLLWDKGIQIASVSEDYRGIKVFSIFPAERIENLQLKYTRGEILLPPLDLANQIRQLKTWTVAERRQNG